MIQRDSQLSWTTMTLAHGVELTTAWAVHLADAIGCRVVVIKGETLHRQQLREPHESSDVDLLVEPEKYEYYLAAVAKSGWSQIDISFAARHFPLHSVAFAREGWPNHLDVHRQYPGFLNSPEDVFEAIWADREEQSFAHRKVQVPSRMAHLMILALHSLRGARDQPRHARELEYLSALPLSITEQSALRQMAAKTGASASLGSLLTRLGAPVSVPDSVFKSREYREWRSRLGGGGSTLSWLLVLRGARRQDALLVLRHALWPPTRNVNAGPHATPASIVGHAGMRLRRLLRGAAALPGAVRAVYLSRSRESPTQTCVGAVSQCDKESTVG